MPSLPCGCLLSKGTIDSSSCTVNLHRQETKQGHFEIGDRVIEIASSLKQVDIIVGIKGNRIKCRQPNGVDYYCHPTEIRKI
jgi:hypothetical protein